MVFELSTAIMGFIGGLLIGCAALLFLLLNGRIAGISGILGGLLTLSSKGSQLWENVAFVGALIGAATVLSVTLVGPDIATPSNLVLLILSGLMVGFGTRLGSGCTSGHGVCGLSRFSIRSLVATCVFMGAGIASVTLIRVLGVL